MPQTSAGETVMAKFVREYGKKGKGYFFGKTVKNKKFAKAVGETSVYNRSHK